MLKKYREEIDTIDDQLLSLLNKRMNCSRNIHKIKEKAQIETVDQSREQEILEKVQLRSCDDLYAIFLAILDESKNVQRKGLFTRGSKELRGKTYLNMFQDYTKEIPPSKSFLQRVLAASLFVKEDIIEISNVSKYSDDVENVLAFLDSIGIKHQYNEETRVLTLNKNYIDRFNINSVKIPKQISFGDSGLATRMFGVLLAAISNEPFELYGDESLRTRKLSDLIHLINKYGGYAYSISHDDKLPIHVDRKMIVPKEIEITDEYKSNQVFTGLVIASLLTYGETTIRVPKTMTSKGYLLITLDVLSQMKLCKITPNVNGFRFEGDTKYVLSSKLESVEQSNTLKILCEPDYSSIAYLDMFLNLYTKDQPQIYDFEYDCNNIRFSQQPDASFKKVFTTILKESLELEYDLSKNLDLFPALCMLLMTKKQFKPVTFHGVSSLVNKESNRIQAMADLLQDFISIEYNEERGSVTVKMLEETSIEKPYNRHIKMNTCNDHRIAMCALALTMFYDREYTLNISNIQCIDKSFPQFFEIYQRVIGKL